MTQIQKIGIVITFHNHATDFVIPCVESVITYTPHPHYIILYDNQSNDTESLLIQNYDWDEKIAISVIKNQKKHGGLTGTWNKGIDQCLSQGCTKIILLNHDTIVDESWPIYIDHIQSPLTLYGPISNKPGYNDNNYQQKTKSYSRKHPHSLRESQHINGFCLGFTSETLKETMYNKKYYFNPAYPFEYNEIEWQKRLKERGGKIMIVEGCYVFHHKDHAWTKIHLNYFQKMKNKIGFWMYKIHPRLYSACARFFPYKDYSTK